jgi:REP element-mobilizing transposase RayT
MRDTYVRILVHLVWATWDRLPLITDEVEKRPYRAFSAVCADMRVKVVAIGGVEDHVHLLVALPATLTVVEVVKRLKGSTSHLITHEVEGASSFKWQGAYAAISVSPRDAEMITHYILRQKEHHATQSLKPEWELGVLEGTPSP